MWLEPTLHCCDVEVPDKFIPFTGTSPQYGERTAGVGDALNQLVVKKGEVAPVAPES